MMTLPSDVLLAEFDHAILKNIIKSILWQSGMIPEPLIVVVILADLHFYHTICQLWYLSKLISVIDEAGAFWHSL